MLSRRTVWFRSTIVTIIYALLYGLFELNVLYRNSVLIIYIGEIYNWLFMFILLSAILFITFGFKLTLDLYVFNLLLFAILEDATYWLCSAAIEKTDAFPVKNWFDNSFSVFTIFRLGQSIDTFPYVPYFYIYGLVMRLIYDVLFFFYQDSLINDIWASICVSLLIGFASTSIVFSPCGLFSKLPVNINKRYISCDMINKEFVLLIFLYISFVMLISRLLIKLIRRLFEIETNQIEYDSQGEHDVEIELIHV